MNKEDLLKKLSMLDFMSIDLALYLDTHPKDVDAIALYNKITNSSDIIRKTYSENYGPLRNYGEVNQCKENWLWDCDPWPWEEKFNFSL